MATFPGKYSFNDIIKFKMRGCGIVEGYIVGISVSCANTDKQYIIYQVHSLEGAEHRFHFKDVEERKIIED